VNTHTIRERRQNGEIAASSVVLVIMGIKVAQSLDKKGIKAAGVWYRGEVFIDAGADGICELCCQGGYIENKCDNKPRCGYYSGNHRTSDHRSNVLGCTAKQGSLCGHTPEKCPNCKENHIAFSSWCGKRSAESEAAQQSKTTGTVGWASTSETPDKSIATNRVGRGYNP